MVLPIVKVARWKLREVNNLERKECGDKAGFDFRSDVTSKTTWVPAGTFLYVAVVLPSQHVAWLSSLS